MQVRRDFRSRAEWLKDVRAKQWISALTSRAARTVVREYPTCSGNDPGVMV